MSRAGTDNEWEKRNLWRPFLCVRLTEIWHVMQEETTRHECVKSFFGSFVSSALM